MKADAQGLRYLLAQKYVSFQVGHQRTYRWSMASSKYGLQNPMSFCLGLNMLRRIRLNWKGINVSVGGGRPEIAPRYWLEAISPCEQSCTRGAVCYNFWKGHCWRFAVKRLYPWNYKMNKNYILGMATNHGSQVTCKCSRRNWST